MMKNGTKTALVRMAHRAVRSGPGRRIGLGILWLAGGFLLAGASVGGHYQPLALALVCASRGGWRAVAGAVGGAAGYLWYFGSGGWQGAVWMLLGLAVSLGQNRFLHLVTD